MVFAYSRTADRQTGKTYNNYGIIGHLSLLQNPVMRLSPHDFGKCVCDMERLRQVSEHTARMNFSSFSYFSRYVSRHFGISPNAYRESLNRVR